MMDILGRYYTNQLFSDLLIQNLETDAPNVILDLGAGEGSLLKAASVRWNNAEFIAADIDLNSVKNITKNLPFVKVYQAIGLKINVEKKIDLKKSSIDVAVCNPPYFKINEKRRFIDLFEEVKLDKCLDMQQITSDVVFLAQNLKLLKNGGELGIILPDTILTGQNFRLLRIALLTNHGIKSIIELPDRIFPRTEAKTHILILEKARNTQKDIPLFISGKDGQCYDQILVKASNLEGRMDYSYHKLLERNFGRKVKTLSELNISLKRGTITHSKAESMGIDYLHSTSFKNGQELYFNKININSSTNVVFAEKGDLIIVRVGRGCVGKAAIIRQGKIPITDCLYVLKGDPIIIRKAWLFLNSAQGEEWIKAISHGVCAKVLSKPDILGLPI